MEPLRPSDHIDSEPQSAEFQQPKLGLIGYLRFFWRQLTTMRTALVLLLLLAVGSIPGSLVPQRTSDPNGVAQYQVDHPDLFGTLDFFQLFTVYSSVWFSAIYLLLFISLIGCVIPRTAHHWQVLKARPPKTPARLQRLAGYTTTQTTTDAETAIESARSLLRKQGYRVERYGLSVSAERGYLRETGNLVFHMALVGMLFAVGILSGFGYTGQKVIVEGQSFTNVLANFDSFNPGRFFTESELVPYSISLDSFAAQYGIDNTTGAAVPLDYTASVTTTMKGGEPQQDTVKVNQPLNIAGNNAYLLGNGYAPVITVYDGDGQVAYSQAVPFLPQDANLTSVGVVKVPDALPEQLGLVGFFYPWATEGHGGALASAYPEPGNPMLTLNVYTGDLGLDDGIPKSVYQLNTDEMTQVAGGDTGVAALELAPGQSADLPNGLGRVEFTELRRFVSLDIHDDPSQGWVLAFAILIFASLAAALFVPRRRMWVKASTAADGTTTLEYAALARGEDPTLEAAVGDIASKHAKTLEA